MTFLTSVLITLFTWYLNESSKRETEEYIRKEERYTKLVSTIRGFSNNYEDNDLRQLFIEELNLCWLYCSDEVIKSGNNFLDSVRDDIKNKDVSPEEALAEFMLTIRKDLIARSKISETKLNKSDFRYLKTN